MLLKVIRKLLTLSENVIRNRKFHFKEKFFVRQKDSMTCGIACIQMICKYYGKGYLADSLSSDRIASQDGISMLCMEEIASSLGFNTVCSRVNVEYLIENLNPCILHWNQNHFVVLYGIDKKMNFYIADPNKGFVVYTIEEIRKHWLNTDYSEGDEGIAMFLEPTSTFYENKAYDENCGTGKYTSRFIFDYIRKNKRYFRQVILGLIACSLIQLLLPFLTQGIVDIGIKNKNIEFVWLVLIGQLVLTISRMVMDVIRSWLLLHMSLRIKMSLISDFFVKLLKLPMIFFDSKHMGDLMQRVNDHSRVSDFLTQHILNVIFDIFCFIIFSVVLLIYDRLVFVVFIVGSTMYGAWTALFLKRRKVFDYELFEQRAIDNNKTYEFITSVQEIKLQNCEQRRRWDWEDTQVNLSKVQMRALKLQQVQEAGAVFINEVKNMIVTVVAATAVIHGKMSLGMMLAVQYIIGQLNSPIYQLTGFFYSLQDVKISLERINEIHNVKNESDDRYSLCSLSNKEDGIRVENVVFKYDVYSSVNIIDKVSIHIPRGKVTAIVGASGSGKTTLVRLLLGYYPVLEGKIYVSGTDINKLNKRWWRKQCGVVMQNGTIFSESIARNIAVDDDAIDWERMLKASEIACVKEFVSSLPLKFSTKIGHDGMELSQGQKQRILIARAVYKNPEFVFFDEATNSLDANNEKIIVGNLGKFFNGRTVMIVAHRLSTVRNADQIVVLEHGSIVEVGNHESLVAKRGAYYKLVKNQLELGN